MDPCSYSVLVAYKSIAFRNSKDGDLEISLDLVSPAASTAMTPTPFSFLVVTSTTPSLALPWNSSWAVRSSSLSQKTVVWSEDWPAMLKIILYLELFYSQLIHQKVISYFFFFFRLQGLLFQHAQECRHILHALNSLLFATQSSCLEFPALSLLPLYVQLSQEVVQSPPRGPFAPVAAKRQSFICWFQRLVGASAKLCSLPRTVDHHHHLPVKMDWPPSGLEYVLISAWLRTVLGGKEVFILPQCSRNTS